MSESTAFAFLSDAVEEEAPIRSRVNPEDNPFVALLRRSAEKLTRDETDDKGNDIWRGTFLGVEVADKEASRGVYLVRAAADYLGWGVSVDKREGSKKGQTKIVFAAKNKRAVKAGDERASQNGSSEDAAE